MEKELNDLINKAEELLHTIWVWKQGGLTKDGGLIAEQNLKNSITKAKNALQQVHTADQQHRGNCPYLVCPFADKCTGLCDWAAGR
ncbi:MAG: hypothetical protein JRF31_03855 [Deltaproteobacteria bacterium]|nr:hypothetical protein [Deltaproteobacteria bacterium]